MAKLLTKEEIEELGIYLDNCNAAINPDGYVEIWFSKCKISPWERSNKKQRHTTKYVDWRTSIFERDKYTCQECGQRGGELNAHHIKPFKEYKSKRYDIDNGITLCRECHKKIHKGELKCPDHKKQE